MRPDIAYGVGQLSKHNVDLTRGYYWAVKQVVWYLKQTIEIRLIFGQESANRLPKDPPLYKLVEYADCNIVGDPEDRKPVMSYCFFLKGVVVSWSSK